MVDLRPVPMLLSSDGSLEWFNYKNPVVFRTKTIPQQLSLLSEIVLVLVISD